MRRDREGTRRLLRCLSNLVAGSERPLPPLLRLASRSWILRRSISLRIADRAHRPQAGLVRVRIVANGRTCSLGPAVRNDIPCALTWSAALAMGYAATCLLACIFRW